MLLEILTSLSLDPSNIQPSEMVYHVINNQQVSIETFRECKLKKNSSNLYLVGNKYVFKDYEYIESGEVIKENPLNKMNTEDSFTICYKNEAWKEPAYKFYSELKAKDACYRDKQEEKRMRTGINQKVYNIYFKKSNEYVNCQIDQSYFNIKEGRK